MRRSAGRGTVVLGRGSSQNRHRRANPTSVGGTSAVSGITEPSKRACELGGVNLCRLGS